MKNQHTDNIIDILSKALSADGKMEKVATTLDKKESMEKVAKLMSNASVMLKIAAEKIKETESENEKLAHKVETLEKEANERIITERSEKLAHLMLDKCMISKDEIPEKIAEIKKMDDTSFHVLNEAISGAPYIEKNAGVEDLTFLAVNGYNKDNQEKKLTLADSFC